MHDALLRGARLGVHSRRYQVFGARAVVHLGDRLGEVRDCFRAVCMTGADWARQDTSMSRRSLETGKVFAEGWASSRVVDQILLLTLPCGRLHQALYVDGPDACVLLCLREESRLVSIKDLRPLAIKRLELKSWPGSIETVSVLNVGVELLVLGCRLLG